MSIIGVLSEIDALDQSAHRKQSTTESAYMKQGLLCVDGKTRISPPAEFREFYTYRDGWSLTRIQLEWPSLSAIPDLLTGPAVSEMLVSDIDRDMIRVRDMRRDNTVLFACDYLPSVYQRAYLLFRDDSDYIIVDAGSEIVTYKSLEEYLEFWRDVLRCDISYDEKS